MRTRVEAHLDRMGIPFEVLQTERPGHGSELARRSAVAGAERILAVGGDGTIHEVANGILRGAPPGSGPALAVVPVGTGNDFFRMVGAPRKVESALEVLTSGAERRFEVGHARWDDGEAWFVNLLGVGLDVSVLQQRDRFARLSGLAQYVAGALSALVRFKPLEIRVEVDGVHRFSGPALISAVTVGPSIGGGFLLSPSASAHDGRLDLFVVEPLSAMQVARYLPRVLRGSHGREAEIHMERITGVRITGAGTEALNFEMDGEVSVATTRSLEVTVVPEALRVIGPAPGQGGEQR
jgi:YegS/Rv2252/BmrU family lipid kinase